MPKQSNANQQQQVNEHGFLVDEAGQVLTGQDGQPLRADGQQPGQAAEGQAEQPAQQQNVQGGDLANVGAEPTQVEGAPEGQGQPVQGGDTSVQENEVSRDEQDAHLRDLGVLADDSGNSNDQQQ